MVDSWNAGRPVPSERSATFADGLAVRVAIPLAVEVLGEVATRMVLVSERRIAEAVGEYASAGVRAEGAAAAALAAVPDLDDLGDPLVARRHRSEHRRRALQAGLRAPRLLPGLNER